MLRVLVFIDFNDFSGDISLGFLKRGVLALTASLRVLLCDISVLCFGFDICRTLSRGFANSFVSFMTDFFFLHKSYNFFKLTVCILDRLVDSSLDILLLDIDFSGFSTVSRLAFLNTLLGLNEDLFADLLFSFL